MEWDGDRWEPPAPDADDAPAWSDDEEVWEPRFDESCEYAAPPLEEEQNARAAEAAEAAEAASGAGTKDAADADAEAPAEAPAAEAPAARETPRARPSGATQRLDFSTQPAATQGTPTGSSPARAPLEAVPPPSQRASPAPASACTSPTAAESARRRLATRPSQSQSQSQSQSRRLKENDPRHRDGVDAGDDDETLGDIARRIEQRRLAALAKRRERERARSAEKREGVERDARLERASMPPPPPRAFASPAATPGSDTRERGGGGATFANEGDRDGGGLGADAPTRFESGEKKREARSDKPSDATGAERRKSDDETLAEKTLGFLGWGASVSESPSPFSQDGLGGWDARASPVERDGTRAPEGGARLPSPPRRRGTAAAPGARLRRKRRGTRTRNETTGAPGGARRLASRRPAASRPPPTPTTCAW